MNTYCSSEKLVCDQKVEQLGELSKVIGAIRRTSGP